MEVMLLHTCLLCFEYYSGYCFSSKCQKTIELFFFEFTIWIFHYSLTFVLTSTIYLQYVHVCTEVYTTLNHWAFCHTSVEKYCSWRLQHWAFFFVQLNPNVIFPSSPWVCFLVGVWLFFFLFLTTVWFRKNTQIHLHSWCSTELEPRKFVTKT